MSTTTEKLKTKRPSKSMRKHIRLVKQETRRNSVPGTVDKKAKRIS
jgi:hypothetical protein